MFKKKNLTEIIILFLVITSLLLLTLNQNTTIIAAHSDTTFDSSSSLQALVDHAPFEITSDDNFTDYGFAGIGTRSDPYIISDYNITTSSTRGIYVKDTTKHFIIRDCYIETGGYGIHFDTVTAGTAIIYDSVLKENAWEGICLDYAPSVSILNVTMIDNAFNGLDLYYSPGLNFVNNTLIDNRGYGVDLWHSANSTLINNTFYNCGVYIYDISLANYLNFSFENNWVNGKILGYFKQIDDLIIIAPDYGQLILINCDQLTIYNQDLSNTAIGMILYWCSNADIQNNTCSNNIEGLYLEQCSYSDIVNNTCNDNADNGLEIVYNDGSNLVNNTFNNNGGYGLWLFITSTCNVYNNTCNDNGWVGIYLWVADDTIVTNNTCIKSNHWGIFLQDSDANLITYNLIQDCIDYGLQLDESSDNNDIYSNHFVDNNLGGTSQGYDDGTMNSWFYGLDSIGNWWSDWDGIPPYYIDGNAANIDPFPDGPIVVSEFQNGIQLIFLVSLFSISMITLTITTKNRLKNC